MRSALLLGLALLAGCASVPVQAPPPERAPIAASPISARASFMVYLPEAHPEIARFLEDTQLFAAVLPGEQAATADLQLLLKTGKAQAEMGFATATIAMPFALECRGRDGAPLASYGETRRFVASMSTDANDRMIREAAIDGGKILIARLVSDDAAQARMRSWLARMREGSGAPGGAGVAPAAPAAPAPPSGPAAVARPVPPPAPAVPTCSYCGQAVAAADTACPHCGASLR